MGGAGFFLRGLDLTEAQRASIETALAKAGLDEPAKDATFKQQMLEKAKSSLAAFAKDSFDAEAVVPEMGHGPHLGRMVKALAVVVPLLDDAQRAALADRIEQGPKHFEGKRGKHKGKRPARSLGAGDAQAL
jgi:Spy/CpxP family protein refolding chaperone